MVKRVTGNDTELILGKVIVVYVHGEYAAARVNSLDKESRKICFEVLQGQHKGKTLTMNYNPEQRIDIYYQESEVLALMFRG